MEFKEIHADDVVVTSDPFYDLFIGGYLKPEKFLKIKEDIEKVKNAVITCKKYLDDLEEKELIEIS